MLRLVVLSLIVLCWAQGSLAQCGGCTSSCSEDCCTWDFPEVNTDPNSLNDPQQFPLGFVTATLPRAESDEPPPCVIFPIPAEVQSKQNYIQVSVQSTTTVCVYETDNPDDESCADEQFFCNPDGYTNVSSVQFTLGCSSCPAAETNLFFRVDIQSLDQVDEYWCDNSNKTLPRDLLMVTAPTSDISQPTAFTGRASGVLIALPLLVMAVLTAALSV